MKKKQSILFLLTFLFLVTVPVIWGLRSEAAYSLVSGDSITLTDDNMTNGTGYTKSWTSSNTSVAEVYGSGRSATVVGKNPGTVRIFCNTHS